jgi:hypothetical protein
MKLRSVPARQGMVWVRAGFMAFFRQPLAFGALFALVSLAALLMLTLPLIGPVLALALMPMASFGFMLLTRVVLAGKTAHPGLLIAALREPLLRRRMLVLGGVYAASTLIVMLLVQQLDGGRFDEAMQSVAEGQATPESLQEAGVGFALMLRLVALSLLSLVFWHTPALVSWGRMGVAQAVFASVLACLRSWAAFAVMGLTWLAATLALVLLAQLFFSALGRPEAATLALLPVGLMLSTVFYASLYFSFVDSFDLDDPGRAPTPPSAPEP